MAGRYTNHPLFFSGRTPPADQGSLGGGKMSRVGVGGGGSVGIGGGGGGTVGDDGGGAAPPTFPGGVYNTSPT